MSGRGKTHTKGQILFHLFHHIGKINGVGNFIQQFLVAALRTKGKSVNATQGFNQSNGTVRKPLSRRGGKGDGQLVPNIKAVTLKQRMGAHRHLHVEVAGRAAILACVEPVVAALVGILAFHESMSPTVGVGVLAILAAVVLLR